MENTPTHPIALLCVSALKVFDLESLEARLKSYLNLMNEETRGKPTQIVFFTNAIGHIVRACRALRSDRGNILMVGVGGSGKETITKLSTYVCGYKLITINTSK